MPKWRKATWVLLIVNLLMLIWVVTAFASIPNYCAGGAGATPPGCQAVSWLGFGSVLWVILFVVSGLTWLMSKPSKRLCPRCGNDVTKGLTVCRSCHFDFAAATVAQSPPAAQPPGWYPDATGQQRWWDGTTWTEHIAMSQNMPPQSQPLPSGPPVYPQGPPVGTPNIPVGKQPWSRTKKILVGLGGGCSGCLVVLIIIGIVGGGAATSQQPTPTPPTPTQHPTSTPLTPTQYKAACTTSMSYAQLSSPNVVQGTCVTGQAQIFQYDSVTGPSMMRVDVTNGGYGYWSGSVELILPNATVGQSLVENDVVEFWGPITAPDTYTTQSGGTDTVPAINVQFVTLVSSP